MGKVVPNGDLITDNLAAMFYRQDTPALAKTDFAFNYGNSNCYDMQGLRPDRWARVVVPVPRFIPHDQNTTIYTGVGLPQLEYDSYGMGSFTNYNVIQNQPWGFYETLFDQDPGYEESLAWGEFDVLLNDSANGPCQGLTCLFKKQVVLQKANESSDTIFRFKIIDGDYNDNDPSTPHWWFSVSFGIGPKPAVAISRDDQATWKIIAASMDPDGDPAGVQGATVPASDGTDNGQFGRYVGVEVIFLNWAVQIHVNGSTSPLVIPIQFTDPDALPVIARAQVYCQHFRRHWASLHPIKWGTDEFIISNPDNLGFTPPTDPFYRIGGVASEVIRNSGVAWAVGFPFGSEIIVTNASAGGPTDQNQQYELRITNPPEGTYRGEDYAGLTAACSRVTTMVRGSWTAPGASTAEDLMAFGTGCKEVREDIALDLNTLTIRHDLQFVLDNFYGGSGLSGDRSGLQGNKGIIFDVGYLAPSGYPLQRHFIGMSTRYEYFRPSNSQAFVRAYCQDQMIQFQRKFNHAPPNMDGWNHYSTMAFLAQLGGLHASQMYFADKVPIVGGGTLALNPSGIIDPYAYVPLTDPTPYFLPLGQGLAPWTPINRSSAILDLMNYIRQPAGFMLYFDRLANLHYEAWVPPSVGAVKKVFGEIPGPGGAADLDQFWDPVVTSSTDDLRNRILLVGIDSYGPGWSPIVTKVEDSDSINNPAAWNYTGIAQDFVWVDSRFANLPFALDTAQRIYNFMRVPEYTVNFETWLQPNIYPMDVISFQEYKSGAYSLPYYVTQVSNVMSIIDGAMRFRSHICGRFITPFL